MSESLDTLAARAVYTSGLFERAVHDPGPWSITWGPYEAEVQREEHPDGVVFQAVFDETCWLAEPEPHIALRCRGEVMAVRPISNPGDFAFAVTWALHARVAAHEHAVS